MKFFKKLSGKIANIQALLILTAAYTLLMPPFVLIMKRVKSVRTGWDKWGIKSDTLGEVEKQY